MRGFPFALADVGAVVARRAPPVDADRRLAMHDGAELPERLADAGALAPVHAMHDGRRDVLGRHHQMRQAARKVERAMLLAMAGRRFLRV